MATKPPVASSAIENTPAPGPDGTVAEPAVDANPANSSVADTPDANDAPRSLLSVVQDALEPKQTEAQTGSSDVEGEGEAKAAVEGGAQPEGEAKTEAEAEAEVPFHNHPRWKKLVAERDAFKDDAESFQGIQNFMQSNGLSGDEVAEGYEIMALLKRGDRDSYTKALEWFEPRVAFLREQVGAVLPDDLATRVESGELDEETAAELAQARAALRLNDQANQERARRAEVETAGAAVQATALTMAKAVQTWEDTTKAADPDYAKKADLVIAMSRSIVQERGGKGPANEQEAIELVKTAYGRVNTTFANLIPKPKQVTPTPAGMSAVVQQPSATTLRGAIEAALQN
jgi:hypothetical protein